MLKSIAVVIFILFTNQANAHDCPDFFRFVDFGLKGNDGAIYRGGPTFRAEGFDGEALLIQNRAKCLEVREISKDGHGNPIPVVKSVHYDPRKTNIDLDELKLSAVDDAKLAAERSAVVHQSNLKQADALLTRGSDFLCANLQEQNKFSCQLVSPYPGNIPLIVYCDALQCSMSSLSVSERISVSAAWEIVEAALNNPEKLGTEILAKVRQINEFIKPLSAEL